jgi:hypothetical protein
VLERPPLPVALPGFESPIYTIPQVTLKIDNEPISKLPFAPVKFGSDPPPPFVNRTIMANVQKI